MVYAWRAVPSFPQIALCFPSLALRPQPFQKSTSHVKVQDHPWSKPLGLALKVTGELCSLAGESGVPIIGDADQNTRSNMAWCRPSRSWPQAWGWPAGWGGSWWMCFVEVEIWRAVLKILPKALWTQALTALTNLHILQILHIFHILHTLHILPKHRSRQGPIHSIYNKVVISSFNKSVVS